MKTVFFECEEWEKKYLVQHLAGQNVQFLPKPLSGETVAYATDAEAIYVFIYSTLTREVLEKLPQLKSISTRSTGYDHIDLAYCKERGILVCNVPEYGTHSVAEHTFALILALSRHIVESVDKTRRGNFDLRGLMGFDLYGKTIGVVGVGSIGRSVIQIAKGFGMRVVATTENPSEIEAKAHGITLLDLKELLSVSDIITLHVPLTKKTRHMINSKNIRRCKKGSLLINTARGGVVETEAIVKGLEEKILAGVGLDVLEEECFVKEERQLLSGRFLAECDLKTQLLNHVLLTQENVIVTPHNAFHSREALTKILDVTVGNILGVASGNRQNIVEA